MKIKFCGIRRIEDVAFVNECQPDYMGMILSAGFRRTISIEQAEWLLQEKSGTVQSVGVFVNESLETMQRIAERLSLDVIQLHGAESPELAAVLVEKTGCEIWKALRIGSAAELEQAGSWNTAQIVLEGNLGNQVGGTGVCADWELLASRQWQRSCFLAGGLTPENVAAAIAAVKPQGVDFSSGIEEQGVKSLQKMQQIIKIVRGV